MILALFSRITQKIDTARPVQKYNGMCGNLVFFRKCRERINGVGGEGLASPFLASLTHGKIKLKVVLKMITTD